MSNLSLLVPHQQFTAPVHSFQLVRSGRAFCLCTLSKKPPGISTLGTKTRPCQVTQSYSSELGNKQGRSAEFNAPVWGPQFLESLRSIYDGAEHKARAEELKQEVKQLLRETDEPLARLEFIDTIQRLGVDYHFEEEIGDALAWFKLDGFESLHGLKETALCFRLLREHGHYVSADVFNKFREGKKFMNCLSQDVDCLLRLYEATQLGLPGEDILEKAEEFSVRRLKCLSENVDLDLVEQVKHSLVTPRRWWVPRLEARYYIDVYERKKERISCLLELAKLDFNMVQSLHQKEVKELSRWWRELGLPETVGHARDRLMECYLWANQTASNPKPKFSKSREVIAKHASIIIPIDDAYDTFSSLEEAELFTSAIRRWDIKAVETLPDYMKSCYTAIYNVVEETANYILQEYGWDVKHFLKREWVRLCEAYLREEQWFHKGITPSLEEYLQNGFISIGAHLLAVHAYYFMVDLTAESLDCFDKEFQLLIFWVSLIIRLTDDLAPSKVEMERASAIPCRMKESGESYEASKEYIEEMVRYCWKEMNKESLNTNLPRNFVDQLINAARMGHLYTEQGHDSFSSSAGITKDRIKSLLFEPIPIKACASPCG